MYRLRNTSSMFKHKELENQVIYLSPSDDEDDIYEGKYVLYFDGNKELWQGIFFILYRHIENNVGIVGDSHEEYMNNVAIPKDPIVAKKMYDYNDDQFQNFINLNSIKRLIELLSNYEGKLYEDVIKKIFLSHVETLAVLNFEYFNKKVNDKVEESNNLLKILLNLDKSFYELLSVNILYDLSDKMKDDNMLDILIATKKRKSIENEILINRDLSSRSAKNVLSSKKLISTFFECLRIISLKKCYIASFTNDYNNSRIWSEYTNYDGICLDFKEKSLINLSASKSNKTEKFKFHKLKYGKTPEFNFFQTIGNIPLEYILCIFKNYDFKKDEYYVVKNIKERYCKWSYSPVLVKDSSWESQHEYRIIMIDLIGNSSTYERTYKYDFKSLNSVIFGEKVTIQNRKKIINILKDKCKINNIHNFNIYSAVRDDSTGKIKKEIYTTIK